MVIYKTFFLSFKYLVFIKKGILFSLNLKVILKKKRTGKERISKYENPVYEVFEKYSFTKIIKLYDEKVDSKKRIILKKELIKEMITTTKKKPSIKLIRDKYSTNTNLFMIFSFHKFNCVREFTELDVEYGLDHYIEATKEFEKIMKEYENKRNCYYIIEMKKNKLKINLGYSYKFKEVPL